MVMEIGTNCSILENPAGVFSGEIKFGDRAFEQRPDVDTCHSNREQACWSQNRKSPSYIIRNNIFLVAFLTNYLIEYASFRAGCNGDPSPGIIINLVHPVPDGPDSYSSLKRTARFRNHIQVNTLGAAACRRFGQVFQQLIQIPASHMVACEDDLRPSLFKDRIQWLDHRAESGISAALCAAKKNIGMGTNGFGMSHYLIKLS